MNLIASLSIAATLIWLTIFHIWKPYRLDPNDPERESLLTHGLPIPKGGLRHRKKERRGSSFERF